MVSAWQKHVFCMNRSEENRQSLVSFWHPMIFALTFHILILRLISSAVISQLNSPECCRWRSGSVAMWLSA